MGFKEFLAALLKGAGAAGFIAAAVTMVPWIALAVVSGQLITVLFGVLLGFTTLTWVAARYNEGVIDGIDNVMSGLCGPNWQTLLEGEPNERV